MELIFIAALVVFGVGWAIGAAIARRMGKPEHKTLGGWLGGCGLVIVAAGIALAGCVYALRGL